MSTYEDYSDISKHYDKTRIPIGGEILLGVLALSGQSGSEIRLLDAGCGTGSYSALALPHVGHIDAMDINPGMLAWTGKHECTPPVAILDRHLPLRLLHASSVAFWTPCAPL